VGGRLRLCSRAQAAGRGPQGLTLGKLKDGAAANVHARRQEARGHAHAHAQAIEELLLPHAAAAELEQAEQAPLRAAMAAFGAGAV
jgi:hypothetical protein